MLEKPTLWYVRDCAGDQDLLVRCSSAKEALWHWRLHFERMAIDEPTYIGPVPLNLSGPIDWSRITDSPLTVHYKPIPD
jgi:hypothetical protein